MYRMTRKQNPQNLNTRTDKIKIRFIIQYVKNFSFKIVKKWDL